MDDLSRAKMLECIGNSIDVIENSGGMTTPYNRGQINSYKILREKIVQRRFDTNPPTEEPFCSTEAKCSQSTNGATATKLV